MFCSAAIVMFAAHSKSSKILLRSGSCWKYLLAASTPVYAGGDVGAPALPLKAPPAPLPLGADCLLRIVTMVQQQLFLLLRYRGLDY